MGEIKITELHKSEKEYLNNQDIICGLGEYRERLNGAYTIIKGKSFHKLRDIVHTIGMDNKCIDELMIDIKKLIEEPEEKDRRYSPIK